MTPYYQDNAVTIYHGDCREIVQRLGRFDLLLTDPPYGPHTDREVMNALFPGRDDMNLVRPRISDLVRAGWLVEIGRRRDVVTGMPGRIVRALGPGERSDGIKVEATDRADCAERDGEG